MDAAPPRPETEPPTITHVEKKPIAKREPIIVPEPEKPRAEPSPALAERREPPPSPPAKPDTTNPSDPANKQAANPATTEARPTRIGTVQSTFDPDKLKLIPQKKYSLTKVLSTPKDFAEQLVIPTGMFHLAPSPADNVNGQRKYAVIEHKIESRGNDSLGMSSAASVELEVEQRLAERLDLLGTKTLAEKMSILTLWISAEGNEMMVKVDILQQCKPRLKRGFAPKGDVDYFTLQVTPEWQVEGKANDEDWERPERLNRFANAWKARVRGYKNMLQANRDAQLNAAMSTLYQGMLRNAAADQCNSGSNSAIGIGR